MITFYPGPSRINSKVPKYFKDAVLDGLLSINHRSKEFEQLYKECAAVLKKKLLIPEDYAVLFTSSATECWEIIAQSVIVQNSFHIYNGAFGKKWYEYTKKIKPGAQSYSFNYQQPLDAFNLAVPSSTEVLAITQNETSNGTALDNSTIKNLRERFSKPLIAVDATSSMAGVQLNFLNADIWFASVQKCFGLPAGLAVLICSPKAIEKALAVNERSHYNSLAFMIDNMRLHQTPYTPNVLNIYLLMRVMQASPDIATIERKLKSRYQTWLDFFKHKESVQPLVQDDKVRSRTVITLSSSNENIKHLKKIAKEAGIVLGNGYGDLKSATFRIANFPSIKKKEINILLDFLEKNII